MSVSVGFKCPNIKCGSDYEQTYYGALIVDDKVVGHRLRCRACQYSWIAPKWEEGELIIDSDSGKYIIVEREL